MQGAYPYFMQPLSSISKIFILSDCSLTKNSFNCWECKIVDFLSSSLLPECWKVDIICWDSKLLISSITYNVFKLTIMTSKRGQQYLDDLHVGTYLENILKLWKVYLVTRSKPRKNPMRLLLSSIQLQINWNQQQHNPSNAEQLQSPISNTPREESLKKSRSIRIPYYN